MRLSNMLISQRLWAGFGLLIFLFMISTGAIAVYGGQTAFAVSETHRTSEVAIKLRESMLAWREARALTWYYVATHDAKAIDEIKAAKLNYENNFDAMYRASRSKKTKALGKTYNAHIQIAFLAS